MRVVNQSNVLVMLTKHEAEAIGDDWTKVFPEYAGYQVISRETLDNGKHILYLSWDDKETYTEDEVYDRILSAYTQEGS